MNKIENDPSDMTKDPIDPAKNTAPTPDVGGDAPGGTTK